MGMILQLSAPGVQNAGEPRQIATDVSGILGQFFNGLGGCLEQGLVSNPLMAAAKGPDLLRHCESEHEVPAGQTAAQLIFQPIPALMVLAPWTMTVATGPVDVMGLAASLTAIDGDAEVTGAAVDDSINDFFMLVRQIREEVQVFRGKGSEDIGDGTHDHTSFMMELMIW